MKGRASSDTVDLRFLGFFLRVPDLKPDPSAQIYADIRKATQELNVPWGLKYQREMLGIGKQMRLIPTS